jgi:hypothetical protein
MELMQGVPAAMAGFGIPEGVLASAHYRDAMTWVFTHMLFFGAFIAVAGAVVTEARAQRALAAAVLVSVLVFGVLDVRTSDSRLGTALYQGPRSLVPPVIDAAVLALFLRLLLVRAKRDERPPP